MRIAIVGGGIFGCTAAIHLNRAGHEVHLFEKQDGLLRGATGLNQFRFHAGYHYPRSPETIRECQRAVDSFCSEYGPACNYRGRHLYAVAREGSRLTPDEYLKACAKGGLDYVVTSTGALLNSDAVELVVEAYEDWIDPSVLRGLVWDRLDGAHVHLGKTASVDLRKQFDHIVIATYAATNEVAWELGCTTEPFQYEVVEKPVLRMPEEFRNVGIVVMDGPFCSLDPYGQTGLHVMGHVEHAIHHANTGTGPEIPDTIAPYLNRGVVLARESRFEAFREAGRKFIPALAEARYEGSMFTVRAVLPDRDDTDERPTLVQPLDGKVTRIFSGKIGTAVEAARSVKSMLDERDRQAA